MNTTYTNESHTNESLTAEPTIASRCVQSCKELLAEIEQAKNRILEEFRATKEAHQNLFKQAVNEAEALAWQTAYPHLLFPALAMEKVQAVAAWQTRQQSVRRNHAVFTGAV
jgi:hypothetical protein